MIGRELACKVCRELGQPGACRVTVRRQAEGLCRCCPREASGVSQAFDGVDQPLPVYLGAFP